MLAAETLREREREVLCPALQTAMMCVCVGGGGSLFLTRVVEAQTALVATLFDPDALFPSLPLDVRELVA